eukprot:205894_1
MKSPVLDGSPNMTSSPNIQNKSNINNEKYKETAFYNETMEILNFAWPVTIATIARMIMYNVDTAFLGHLGTAQLAGSAMASMCANFVSTFLYAPAYGLNSL